MAETGLTTFTNYFMPMITNQLQGNSIQMTDYQRMCAMSASQQMFDLIAKNHIDPNSIASDISDMLMTVVSLQLNANAQPSEVYFQTRKHYDKQSRSYSMTIEMGIEGDGNDAILARFGRNVKHVYPVWIVREGDKYTPAKRRGVHMTDPEWEPIDGSDAKAVRVVYPIEFWTDENHSESTIEYYSTNRELVKPNLIAHMINNIRSEQYDKKNPKKYEEHCMAIKEFCAAHTIDQILDDKTMQTIGKISPAWREPQSREQMIIRKMRNNIVKKIPKDFSNGLAVVSYEKASNESYKEARRDVTENANQTDFDAAKKPEQPVADQVKGAAPESPTSEASAAPSTPDNSEQDQEATPTPSSQVQEEVDPY